MKMILFILCLITNFALCAQPGTLDSSFAGNGINLNENSRPFCVATQKNDKIIIGGAAGSDGRLGSGLIRYTVDGRIDSSFGKNGYAILNYEVAGQGPFSSIVILPDDKIIATSAGSNIFTAKFTADGKLDSSFGTNGYVLNHFAFVESISDIVVQDDGKILVSGAVTTSFTDPFYGIIVCYTPEGKLDLAFGDSGKVILTQSTGLSSIAIQEDGKIVAGGTADVGESEFYVGRLNTDGGYDKSFGDRGYVYTRFFKNRRDGLASIILQPDGKILAAGYCNSFGLNQEMGIARYNMDGGLDNNFGTNGFSNIHVYNSSEASTVLLQKDGKIILSGRTFDDIAAKSDAVLVRLSSNAFIDSSFATNGIAVTDLSNGGYDSEYGAILQKDGKVIISGESDFKTGENFGNIARFKNDDNKSRKQIIITKIRRWLHHNGIEWDKVPGEKSYTILRSGDGLSWTTVRQISAMSNYSSQSIITYYNDISSLSNGINYYRVQTTNVSGAISNSNIITISTHELKISVSPNPAKNVLEIQGLPSKQNIKLTTVEFSGNTSSSCQVSTISGSYKLGIAQLKAGNYWLKIEVNKEVSSLQFVKE